MTIGSGNLGAVSGAMDVDAASKASPQRTKLEAGAKEFEAMMLEQMLKPLKFGQMEGTEDEEASGASGTVQGFATEAIAKGIASKGGLGIARQIMRQVSTEEKQKGGS